MRHTVSVRWRLADDDPAYVIRNARAQPMQEYLSQQKIE
jgi:hypothetical protein